MSYDLQVWSTQPPPLPVCLPDGTQWQTQSDLWTWARKGWQIVAGPVHAVDPDDVPEDVRAALPGISHMVEFNLEPLSAPQSAYVLLKRVAKAVALQSHGAVVDPQSGIVTTPTGVRRWVGQPRSQTVTALQLSWFSVDDRLASRAGLERVVRCLEQRVPEALPVRYGLYEPPSFRYSEMGREHFIDFLAEEYLAPGNLGLAVWSPKRPVLDVRLSLGVGKRRPGDGWGCHRLTVTLDAAVLGQSGWPTAVQRLWRHMTHDVHAFYADARVLLGYRLGSGTEAEWRASGRRTCHGGRSSHSSPIARVRMRSSHRPSGRSTEMLSQLWAPCLINWPSNHPVTARASVPILARLTRPNGRSATCRSECPPLAARKLQPREKNGRTCDRVRGSRFGRGRLRRLGGQVSLPMLVRAASPSRFHSL